MGEVLLFLILLGIGWYFGPTLGRNDHSGADDLPYLDSCEICNPSPVIRRLTEVRDFTDAIVRMRVNAALSADQKLAELDESYSRNLERLANAGQLTEDVEKAFRSFAETSATAVTGLAADFGSSLHLLVKTYDGRYRRRLR